MPSPGCGEAGSALLDLSDFAVEFLDYFLCLRRVNLERVELFRCSQFELDGFLQSLYVAVLGSLRDLYEFLCVEDLLGHECSASFWHQFAVNSVLSVLVKAGTPCDKV